MTSSVPGGERDALAHARAEIERIDRAIVGLVAERVRAAAEVARAKRRTGLPTLDPQQEARVVRRAAEFAREQELPEEAVRDLLWRIIALTRRSQDDGA